MDKQCAGLNECSKKVCLEQGRCEISMYWENYWRNKHKPRVVKEILLVAERKRKAKESAVEANRKKQKELNKWDYKSRKCAEKGKCNKKKVCYFLGQCILQHPEIINNEQHKCYLRQPLSTKQVIVYLEYIRPSLKRIGERQFYKPEQQTT